MFETPVLLLLFNRPKETQQVIDALQVVRPSKIYVAIDGPRKNNEKDIKLISEVESIIENINWSCNIRTLKRVNNVGCKNAVSDAIDWLFNNEEEAIIIEDDCLPSESFFFFCEKMLAKYRHDSRIAQICGFNPLNIDRAMKYDYFYSYLGSVWGWATWKRAWQNYDISMHDWPDIMSKNQLQYQYISSLLRNQRYIAYEKTYNGKISTWDYQWAYTRAINNQLCVIPSKSLIKNLGCNDDGTNIKRKPRWLESNVCNEIDCDRLISPPNMLPNVKYEKRFSRRAKPWFGAEIYYLIRVSQLKLMDRN
ncbi:hypothetical protein [Synechococcus sp. M16.1]|uniref:hypothetical protein n=1 Tax=Synechococcus sp. M16.1 TaxID=1442553 RepID=UPI001644B822|nr:hypothetical protein [Synechococcus sp. M16.1]QNJ12215.1 nucleotide-diphospho-sugar transferase [Synechococcus sp. M16.1]